MPHLAPPPVVRHWELGNPQLDRTCSTFKNFWFRVFQRRKKYTKGCLKRPSNKDVKREIKERKKKKKNKLET
jgi:hypothetical protein